MSEMIQRIINVIEDYDTECKVMDCYPDSRYLARSILERMLQPNVVMINAGNSSAETVNADVVYMTMIREALDERK